MVQLRALVALACLVSVITIGCAATPSVSPSPRAPSVFFAESTGPPTTPQPSSILTVETRGGECPEGACRSLVNVEADGTVHQVLPTDKTLGTVPAELVEALRIEVEQANYLLLQSRPFTGECPTAFDGQETIYTFHVSTGDERMASCEVAIDENHPLFRAVAAVLASAAG